MITLKKLEENFEAFSKDFKQKLADLGSTLSKPRLINIQIPNTTFDLADGEIYIGATISADGNNYATILLPGDKDDGNWQDAMDWAKAQGGDLPNRIEQAVLFAQFQEEFKKDVYWSNTQHASYDGYAWCQYFGSGFQGYGGKSYFDIRARAVRRVQI